jgi:hypothetical protein
MATGGGPAGRARPVGGGWSDASRDTRSRTTNAFGLNQLGPGPILPGGEASLLVVDGNPLVDIRSLRHLSGVVLRGQLLGPEELARLRNLAR